MKSQIELRASSTGIDPARVHFTFASGRFSYNCVSCGAKCCRGHGYLVQLNHEFKTLKQIHPAIQHFVDVNAMPMPAATIINYPPACFYLNANNTCRVQAENGYDSKPETCRLFPFNHLRRIGNYLIVAPHVALCPLDVSESRERSALSDHSRLLADISTGIHVTVPAVQGIHPDTDALIALEKRIVDLSEVHQDRPDYCPFAVRQLLAAEEAGLCPGHEPGEVELRLCEFRRNVCDLLGASGMTLDVEAHNVLVATTPLIRSLIVFTSEQVSISLQRLPYALVVLEILLGLAREAGMEKITYQTVVSIFQTQFAMIEVLAHLDCVVAWRQGVSIDLRLIEGSDFQMRYLRAAKSLLYRRQCTAQRTLRDVLNEALGGEHRIRQLRQLIRLLAGRLQPIADRPQSQSKRRLHLRPRLQRLALSSIGEENLLTVLQSAQRFGVGAKHTA